MDEISRVVSQATSVGLFLSIPALVGALLFSESILTVLFGPAYAAGAVVLPILMGEKVIRSIQVVLNTTLRGIDQPRESAIATGTTVVVNLVLNFALVPMYGIRGAAFATIGSVCLNAALHWYFLRNHVSLRFPGGLTLVIVALSSLMGGVLFLLAQVFDVNGLVGLLAIVAGGAAMYFVFAAFVPTLRRTLLRPGIRVVLASIGLRRG